MLVRDGIKVDEDELTHAVFGLLRYLPFNLWFQDFIYELRRRNPNALPTLETSSQFEISLWPSYPIPDDWRLKFWRPKAKRGVVDTLKGTICPDALIETDEWLMLVESEYSHDLDSEQMFQQFAIASEKGSAKDFFILLVNRALTRPSHCEVCSDKLNKPEAGIQKHDSLEKFISQSCTLSLGLPYSEVEVQKRFLWINWQSIQGILANLSFENNPDFVSVPPRFQQMINLMRDDVCELLEKERLIPIQFSVTLDLAEFSINQHAIPELPVVSPIIQFLAHLEVETEYIPKWAESSDIQKILKNSRLWFSCLPEPFFSKYP